MNSKELIRATLAGRAVPCVAVGPLAVHWCAELAGYSLRQYTTSAHAMTRSIMAYHEACRPDALWVSADTWVSAEAMGTAVGSTEENQPFGRLGEPLIQTAADIDRIPVPQVQCQGRYPLMLSVLREVAQRVGTQAFVIGCFDQYPFSLAAALMGLDQVMVKAVEDPSFVRALMERCFEYALEYGCALSNAGADLLSGGDSPAVLLGPKLYETIAFPCEKRLVDELKSRTGKPVSLHICGNATSILPRMAQTGADVLEIDQSVDIATALRQVDNFTTLWGNLDPVRVLAQGTPAHVRAEARRVLASVRSEGRSRFVLSSGCTLAVGTPPENIKALIDSCR